jgi:flavin reductase (DIM6/NTAB) family NADH-FMN oxidoreductase RutF
MFSATSAKTDQDGTKDTVANIRETGVFCVNIVSEKQLSEMNKSSQALSKEIDEFEFSDIEKQECNAINCSLVAGGPAALECKMTEIVTLSGQANFAVFGQVIGIHMRDDCIIDGRFEIKMYNPVSRLGYRDYAIIKDYFELRRPDDN